MVGRRETFRGQIDEGQHESMNKNYNKFERAHDIMAELIKAPLPLEPVELGNISDRELGFLKSSVEMMADYLDSLGFDFRGHKEEVLTPIYEEFERRQK